ncbi:MAG: hypothetical protein WCD79_19595 [Chthoniobacteraceae bacterium]
MRQSGKDFEEPLRIKGTATKVLKQSDADRIEITIASRKPGGLNIKLPHLEEWIKKLRGGKNDLDSPINSVKATARPNYKEPPEVLDLLHHHILKEVDLTPVKDKRYPLKSRCDAIHRAYIEWKYLMK